MYGGPFRPAQPPKAKNTKGANSLEKQIDFGSLDICALELATADEGDDDEGEWTDWDRDPRLLGGTLDGSRAMSPSSARILLAHWQRSPCNPLSDPPPCSRKPECTNR